MSVAGFVLGALQDCTEWYESVAFHDGVHPSAMFRPHALGVPHEDLRWDDGGLFPDGDFMIFVPRDHGYGIVGDPWAQTLCVFGMPAVEAVGRRNAGVLKPRLR